MSTFQENRKLTVIQLFGGPSIGKSTTAAELFALMKKRSKKVEFIHEVAKDLVWERANHMFYEQDWIFAHQHRLQRRLVDHDIDYAVTDTSILLGLFYMDPTYPKSLQGLIEETFHSYTNLNIMLTRNPDFSYEQTGRNQTEAEAHALDRRIRDYFNDNLIAYHNVLAGDTAASEIYKIVQEQKGRYA